jgi:hypothetical protein
MARHKTVTHLPAQAPSQPRLLSQLLSALGELVVVAVFLLGLVTAGAWLLAGYDAYARMARQLTPAPPGQWVHCWRDSRGEICRPEDRGPMRRYPVGGI